MAAICKNSSSFTACGGNMFFVKTSHWGLPGFVFVLWAIISFAARDLRAASFRLVSSLLALCLALFSAFTPVPAQAADDLYIYSGGGGGGGTAESLGKHGGGGGGGYVGAADGGAGAGGNGSEVGSGGAGGGNANASLNGGDSTNTLGGIGGGTGPYAGGAGEVYPGNVGGSGGNGGSIINPVILSTQFNHITMGAGQGGNGGTALVFAGGRGGNGGDIALTLNPDAMVLGNGGESSFSFDDGGDGGTGGRASLGVSSSLTISGNIALTSGSNGSPALAGAGAGGAGGGVFWLHRCWCYRLSLHPGFRQQQWGRAHCGPYQERRRGQGRRGAAAGPGAGGGRRGGAG